MHDRQSPCSEHVSGMHWLVLQLMLANPVLHIQDSSVPDPLVMMLHRVWL